MSAQARACADCLARTKLVAELAPHVDAARRGRRPLRDVLALDDEQLARAVAGRRTPEVRDAVRAFRAEAALARASVAGLALLCRHDPGYPGRLHDDTSAPAVLHVLGDLERLTGALGDGQPVVAVIGARRATAAGLEVARTLARGLAAAGVTVVSGMALGIDAAAHAGALDAGGRTVAVLAGAAEVPYPRRYAALHRRIAESGGVISEMPPGFRARRWSFPARNRVIAALADATVVVEAAEESGSLITAGMALDLGREVAAVPGPVTSPRSAGTNKLIRDGATLVRDARDVLDLVLGVDAAAVRERSGARPGAAPPDLDPALRVLLDCVDEGRDTVEAIAGSVDGARAAAIGLARLELLGVVRRAPGGRYLRTPG